MEPETEMKQNNQSEDGVDTSTKLEPQPQAGLKQSDTTAELKKSDTNAESAVEKKYAAEKQPKETDLGYDVDPIDVARQVAIEAKMEVEGREHSSSSSDKLPGGGEVQQHSSTPEDGSEDTMKADSSSSAPASSDEEEEEEEEKVAPAQEAAEQSQLTEVPAEPEKGLAFDLNTEVFSEASSEKKLLGFDLNSAEIPSGESAAGGRPGFDLNLASDEGEELLPADWMAHRSTLFCQSPASSSSKNPARKFDLNAADQFPSRLSQQQPPPPSVISIFGTQVEVGRNHHTPPPPQALHIFNGGSPFSAVPYPLQHAGSMVPYHSPAMYASPGHAAAAAAAYQYMLDSRGVPVVPQMMGPASAHHPYFVNMPGGPHSNGTHPAIPQAMGSNSAQHPYFLSSPGGPSSNGTGSGIPHHYMGSTSGHLSPYHLMTNGPSSNGTGSGIIPQPIGPSSLQQPPFYMGMAAGPPSHGPGPGSVPSRTSFDPNNINNAGGSRNMGFAGPGGLSWEVSSSQASSSSGAGAKRREPDSGQEEPASYRQQQPRWN